MMAKQMQSPEQLSDADLRRGAECIAIVLQGQDATAYLPCGTRDEQAYMAAVDFYFLVENVVRERPDFFDCSSTDTTQLDALIEFWRTPRNALQLAACTLWCQDSLVKDARTKTACQLARKIKKITGITVHEQAVLIAAWGFGFNPGRRANGDWIIDPVDAP